MFNPNPELLLLGGQGIDEKGLERKVIFHVSRKTGKKCGGYTIYRPGNEHLVPIENCCYLNDLLHGDDVFYGQGCVAKKICFLRGKQLKGENLMCEGGHTFGEVEKRARKNTAEKSHSLRKLLSNASVSEAIKTGNVLKVKSAMTRALKKKEIGE